ncbi:hypothetical protein GCK72_016904 [Caenorhabditis remanei]|uniref:F-box domain-containing protein n=1 Tax=Caenorhabditis remanei TaxID=31234 RepID=A0A6A5G6R9_CAERE|nr:hypothetical protein GCK72_016904 [Caenorhabditis remanei]KAF1750355.1 hypothetical protein GCK72_016904 [Caenorhabditis remanei]
MSKAFSLLKLPRLALDEILLTMRPFELIQFSMTSSKTRIIMKYLLRTRVNLKYKLLVNTFNEPKITVLGSDTFFDCRLTSDKLRSEQTEYFEDAHGLKADRIWMYSENVIMDWMKLFKIVTELFNFQRHAVSFRLDTFPDQNKTIIDLIRSQLSFSHFFRFDGKIVADQDVEYALKNINVTEFLNFKCALSNNFQLKISKTLEKITVTDGNWLNYNSLIQLKAYELEIKGSKITNVELNAFLISWMSSDIHQDLAHLEIPVSDPDRLDSIFDLPHERIDDDVIRHGKTVKNEVFRMRGGIDIKRNDGATGTIYFTMDGDQLMLNMIVFALFV